MTREEFKAKFEGNKIKHKIWGNGRFLTPIYWGKKGVLIENTFGGEVFHFYDDMTFEDYELYKEPEPTFDWEAKGFWAKHKREELITFFDKASKYTWFLYGHDANVGAYLGKKEIIEEFKPCNRPDNYKDYGVEE